MPIFTFEASRKGCVLKAGSSAMEASLATRLPREDGEVEFAEGDLAAEGGGERRFNASAEGVGIEEERDRNAR